MTGTKTLRYDTTVLDARALADALEAEEKAGWEVAGGRLRRARTLS